MRGKFQNIDKEEFKRLFLDAAISVFTLSQKYNVGRWTIYEWAKRLGLASFIGLRTAKRRSTKPCTDEGQKLFYKECLMSSKAALGEKYKVRPNTMQGWLRELKETSREMFESGDDPSYAELMNLAKEEDRIMNKLLSKESSISYDLKVKVPIILTFSSDWHIGSVGTNHELLDRDLTTIERMPNLYVYLGGDFIENFIEPQKIAAGLNQQQILRQRALMVRALEKIKFKVLAIGTSCHQLWSDKAVGFDLLRDLARDLNIIYTAYGGLFVLKVGSVAYKIFRRHKYNFNSSFNLTHSVKQMWRMGPSDFDIGVIEHGHVPSIEGFVSHGEKKVAIRTGTYKIYDEYALEKGLYGARIANPSIILFPSEKRMLPFDDMYDAITAYKGLSQG